MNCCIHIIQYNLYKIICTSPMCCSVPPASHHGVCRNEYRVVSKSPQTPAPTPAPTPPTPEPTPSPTQNHVGEPNMGSLLSMVGQEREQINTIKYFVGNVRFVVDVVGGALAN